MKTSLVVAALALLLGGCTVCSARTGGVEMIDENGNRVVLVEPREHCSSVVVLPGWKTYPGEDRHRLPVYKGDKETQP